MSSKHDSLTRRLKETLNERGKYFSVAREVPMYKNPFTMNQLAGQADVLALRNGRLRYVSYFEVKTGRVDNGHAYALKQARAFYEYMDKNHPHIHPHFVLYNPNHEERPVIGRFRRVHRSEVGL